VNNQYHPFGYTLTIILQLITMHAMTVKPTVRSVYTYTGTSVV